MIISSQGQGIVGEALPGSRRDYPEGWKDLSQEMALLGPMLFVRCTGDTVGASFAHRESGVQSDRRKKNKRETPQNLSPYIPLRFLGTSLSCPDNATQLSMVSSHARATVRHS
jgi:hypothetical protein